MAYVTIDGFERLTAQQVFDISKNHLLSQNEKSMVTNPDGEGLICAYRGEKGRMCAAGPFLKDEEVSKCEANDWSRLNSDKKVPNAHYDLVNTLQDVHDYNDPHTWEMELKKVAKEFNLVY